MSAATTMAALAKAKFPATVTAQKRTANGRVTSSRRKYNPKLDAAKGRSGVYAIWIDGKLRYIGESHSGRLYDTLTRHFRKWNEDNTSYQRSRAEVAFTTRPRDPEKAQAALIEHAKPPDNIECTGEGHSCAAGTRRATRNPGGVEVEVEQLGTVRRIEYIRAEDGELYYHDFTKGTALYVAGEGRALLIAGPRLQVGEFIEG